MEILFETFPAFGVRPIKSQSPDDTIIAAIRDLQKTRQPPLVIALDGRSGVGKSTLAEQLAHRCGAAVIQGDDFYAGGTDAEWAQKTASEKVANCIDWRRIRNEALIPLRAGQAASWHPFDFTAGAGLAVHLEHRDPASVIIIDGIYSARPELRDLIDLAVLIEMHDDGARRQRLLEREGQPFMNAWHALWDEAENEYFANICPRESFDLVISGG